MSQSISKDQRKKGKMVDTSLEQNWKGQEVLSQLC